MEIVLVGLNHKTAPVNIRECLAFPGEEIPKALVRLVENPAISEALMLSTCNRVEVLAAGPSGQEAVEAVKDFLAREKGLQLRDFADSLFVCEADEACRHLFRVAASLDSMIVGEPQILGQVKESYRQAIAAKTTGVILNKLMHRGFSVAKRIRKETGIGDHAVSISYAAVELAKKIFEDLLGRKVLLVGAGEMAELAVEHLINHRAKDIFVANRTFERAVELARRFSGTPVRFSEIGRVLTSVDIVISSTGSPEIVINKDTVKAAMKARKNRPLFFIDIAVPRDVDPQINRLENAYVYDIDDLSGIVENNLAERMKEAVRAESIVDEAVLTYREWFSSLDVVPTIKALKDKMDAIRIAETRKSLAGLKDLTQEQRAAIDRLTESIVNKALHDPIQFLKGSGHRTGKKRDYIGITRDMFKLD
ncbi:MAG: glutamyl-tRNA reductase [Desulfatibacillaceae bacterium]|nr:glutamyl-tRNA reductase [Desulfatibacillaceae bacterium]